MEAAPTQRTDYREIGRYAYKTCGHNPIAHANMMVEDIRRMGDPLWYKQPLLLGFRAAAEEAGDRKTVEYVDKVLKE